MQAGLVYGQIGQTEYIIRQVRKESGYDNMKVVATGGLGRIIADETDEIQIYDRDLTLEGLRIIYEKNTDRRGNSQASIHSGADGRCNRPAISSAMQRAGRGTVVYGNDQCQGITV